MDTGSVLGIIGIVISVVTAIVGAINHTKIRSKCMGKVIDMSIDIEKSSPMEKTLPIIESV